MLIPSLSVPLQAENEPLPTLLDRREIILRGKEWNRILHSASGAQGTRTCRKTAFAWDETTVNRENNETVAQQCANVCHFLSQNV